MSLDTRTDTSVGAEMRSKVNDSLALIAKNADRA